jgi:hypothetical protein
MGQLIFYILVLILMWHYLDIRHDMESKWNILVYAIFSTLVLFHMISHIFLK